MQRAGSPDLWRLAFFYISQINDDWLFEGETD